MADLRIYDDRNGGDAILRGNDLVIVDGFQNMPYIGMFGGNFEQDTENDRNPDEQAYDWWGNRLLMENNKSIQLNSLLERALDNVVLNSSGRIELEALIKKDLQFMTDFCDITVTVSIVTVDRILIFLKINQPDNLQANEFTYLWDGAANELTELTDNTESTIGLGTALNNLLNYQL